jgi:hypothetical protein
MAQAKLDLDLKSGRNLNANLKNFMAQGNSKIRFDLKI